MQFCNKTVGSNYKIEATKNERQPTYGWGP